MNFKLTKSSINYEKSTCRKYNNKMETSVQSGFLKRYRKIFIFQKSNVFLG